MKMCSPAIQQGGSGVIALRQSALLSPEPEQSVCVKPPPISAECYATVPSGREITPGKIHCVSSKQRPCFASAAGRIPFSFVL